jgi:transketolase
MKISEPELKRARLRLLQMHFEAGVGHIGGNLSCLDALMVLHHEFVGPDDRFILSKGHSAGALYAVLWSLGKLSDEALKTFTRDDTLLGVHPPVSGIADIRFATGSLGHGLSLAAGTAKALQLAGRPGRVFCLTSDGEWQEGSTYEALVFAAHHQLANLTILIDHNGLQGFGSTAEIASMAPLASRFAGFDVDIEMVDGHDPAAIREALSATGRLKIAVLETHKGHGVSFMQDRMEWHYLPLDAAQYRQAVAEIESR